MSDALEHTSDPDAADRAARHAEVRRAAWAARRRPWRIAFVVYAVALTVGTHWPQLRIGPELPATDKVIHLLGFGGLAWLLWRTQWIRQRWLVLVVTVLWAALDEVSQGIPMLQRTVTPEDIVANALGVTIAGAIMWAHAACGDRLNRRRLAIDALAFDRTVMPTHRLVTMMALCGQLVFVYVIARRVVDDVAVGRALVIASAGLAACGTLGVLVWRWRTERAAILRSCACVVCGTSCATITERDGTVTCATCGTEHAAHQWRGAPALAPREIAVIAWRPIVGAIVTFGVVIGLVLASGVLYGAIVEREPAALGAVHAMNKLPDGFETIIDLTLILTVSAAFVGIYRRSIARYHDRAVRCRACGHDLRGVSLTWRDGVACGACPECGATFESTAAELDHAAPGASA